MNRRDNESSLKIITDLISDAENIKKSQPLAGDGWIVYRNTTSNSWDIDVTIDDFALRIYEIIFVPGDSSRISPARLTADTTISGTAVADIYTTSEYNEHHKWLCVIRTDTISLNSGTINVKKKFTVYSTQVGALTVTNIISVS